MLDIRDINADNLTLKGEFVLILSGKKRESIDEISSYDKKIEELLDQGLRTKEIVKSILKESSLSKNEVYDYVIKFNK